MGENLGTIDTDPVEGRVRENIAKSKSDAKSRVTLKTYMLFLVAQY